MFMIHTNGLLLRKQKFSESSLIIRVVTQEHGPVSLIAKGVNHKRSKFRGVLDFFQIGEFVYRPSNTSELFTLRDLSPQHVFSNMQEILWKQALGWLLAEFIYRYGLIGDNAAKPYTLLRLSYEEIECDQVSTGALRCAHLLRFLIRFCYKSGFYPHITDCCQCDQKLPVAKSKWSHESGGMICSNCVNHHVLPIPEEAVFLLARLADFIPGEGIQGFQGSIQSWQFLENLLLSYIGRHFGEEKKLSSLDFYRSTLKADSE